MSAFAAHPFLTLLPRYCCIGMRELIWVALGILLHILCITWVFNLLYTPTPASAAPELIVESVTLLLAEVESEISTEATPQEAAPSIVKPTPELAPYLTAPDSQFVLPSASLLALAQPDLSGLPMPEIPLPALPEQVEHLPEITLPPAQPLEAAPSSKPSQQATGATARVEKPEMITDLSQLRKSYPEVARRQGWEGTVTLRLIINANGRLETTEVIQSSGYSVLDKEAARMLRKARFRNGPGELIQSITYSLETTRTKKRR